MTENSHNVLSEATQKLRTVSYKLESLSIAFYKTGNESVSDNLMSISKDIDEIEKAISKETGVIIHDRLMDAQQASANVFSAALAGMKIAKEKK